METKNNIFEEYLGEYLKAGKDKKTKILNHVCFVTKMHRKAAIRKFRDLQLHDPYKEEKRGRSEYYGLDVTVALKAVWEAGNEVCGELLFPVINEYIDILVRDKLWSHGDTATSKLRAMKLATVKRRVGNFLKARGKRSGVSATRPSHLKHIIPTFNGPWKELPPGNGQIDTVLHNNTLLGDAVYTLNYTDSATCLCVPRAQWNKGQEATLESMKEIKQRLPYLWLMAHPDTGSEFINYLAKDWFEQNDIKFTRSRPGRKNDNMYVEERNGHVIRKMVGYINLTCRETVDALNDYYDVMTPYLMHFVTVRRMIGKEKDNSKYKRIYEKIPKTPYQRILEHTTITEDVKEKLRQDHLKLNPLILKKEMEKRLKKVYDIQRRFGNKRD
ncbi:MAG: hypothetical protein COV70_00160 [Parcubacteria group bacterium CG11_big_fil_rev_8_21_14_0_20_39_22]|nr:MAG: hypothetical protein COV70_00160 [Parcubacteria group bacterium CG11_big_fil_rev_8_21_14_0_20_39_22]